MDGETSCFTKLRVLSSLIYVASNYFFGDPFFVPPYCVIVHVCVFSDPLRTKTERSDPHRRQSDTGRKRNYQCHFSVPAYPCVQNTWDGVPMNEVNFYCRVF